MIQRGSYDRLSNGKQTNQLMTAMMMTMNYKLEVNGNKTKLIHVPDELSAASTIGSE